MLSLRLTDIFHSTLIGKLLPYEVAVPPVNVSRMSAGSMQSVLLQALFYIKDNRRKRLHGTEHKPRFV